MNIWKYKDQTGPKWYLNLIFFIIDTFCIFKSIVEINQTGLKYFYKIMLGFKFH